MHTTCIVELHFVVVGNLPADEGCGENLVEVGIARVNGLKIGFAFTTFAYLLIEVGALGVNLPVFVAQTYLITQSLCDLAGIVDIGSMDIHIVDEAVVEGDDIHGAGFIVPGTCWRIFATPIGLVSCFELGNLVDGLHVVNLEAPTVVLHLAMLALVASDSRIKCGTGSRLIHISGSSDEEMWLQVGGATRETYDTYKASAIEAGCTEIQQDNNDNENTDITWLIDTVDDPARTIKLEYWDSASILHIKVRLGTDKWFEH